MKKIIRTIVFLLLLMFAFGLFGCGSQQSVSQEVLPVNHEKGLYFNNVGPIPAKIIMQSTNLLSVEISDIDIQEYLDELGN